MLNDVNKYLNLFRILSIHNKSYSIVFSVYFQRNSKPALHWGTALEKLLMLKVMHC